MINEQLEKDIELCVKNFFRERYQTMDFAFPGIIKNYLGDNAKGYQHYYPLSLVWELTSDCNLRCKHCYYHDYNEKFVSNDDLSSEKIMEIIDEVAEMNVIHITLSGGEPLLAKNIFEIIKKIKSKNIAIKFSTNGTLVTQDIAKKLSQLLNPKMDDVQISLDGACKETHDITRGKGSFEKTMQGIENLITNGIHPLINFTTTTHNVSELADLYTLTKSFGAKMLSVGKIMSCGSSQEPLVPDTITLFEQVAKVIRLEMEGDGPFFEMRTFKIFDFVNNPIAKKYLNARINIKDKSKPEDYICHNHQKINISAKGKVYLCFYAADNDLFPMGNLNNETLLEVWNKRHENNLFQKRALNDMICKECEYIKFCHSGCPLSSYQKYGSLLAPDKNCACGECLVQNANVKI